VPIVQKEIIRKCNRATKFVITATQMLESMTENHIPERAEVSDVANAILDGSDYVMLSAESAVGLYPVECVDMMNKIIKFTETNSYLAAKKRGVEKKKRILCKI
jgi:pyruvate kinase